MNARARLLEARDHLSATFEIVDAIGPELPSPEREAVVGVIGLRHDVSRIIRSLGNIAATTTAKMERYGHPSASRTPPTRSGRSK